MQRDTSRARRYRQITTGSHRCQCDRTISVNKWICAACAGVTVVRSERHKAKVAARGRVAV